jgi:rhodanese-related sulfurtransferase
MVALWLALPLVLSATPPPAKSAPDAGVRVASTKPIKKLNAVEFKAALKKAREANRFTLVDVREPKETAGGYVQGAVLMPIDSGIFARDHGKLAKDRPVLIYCGAGRRATRAGEMLSQEGWKDVSVLYNGGYEDLKKK